MSLKNLSVKNKIPKLLENNLKNKKILKIYRSFEKSLNLNDKFAVAVSGGPDSLALAYLAKIYSIKKQLEVKFLFVDHKLRNESTKEAKNVKKILKKFNLKVEILTWRGKKPKSNIQSLAREKRYNLLLSKCLENNFKNIIFAHHRDDVIENFFIRFLRGSGLKGLVSLDNRSKINGINIWRPLIEIEKKELEFISKKVFNFFVRDPSNYDEKFQRIRVRKIISKLEKEGLNKNMFYKTIKNLKSSNNAINFYVIDNLKKNCTYSLKKKKGLF